MGDGFVDRREAREHRQISECRMRAVQHAQLGELERHHVVDELRAGLLPRGTSRRKAVFDHPLAERLARHGRGVFHVATRRARLRGRRRWWRARCDPPSSTETRRARRSSRRVRASSVRANDTTACFNAAPLCERLSHESTVNGGVPASRRCLSAAARMPGTVRRFVGMRQIVYDPSVRSGRRRRFSYRGSSLFR